MVTTHHKNLVLVKVILIAFFPNGICMYIPSFSKMHTFGSFGICPFYFNVSIYTKNKLNCDLWSSFILIDNAFKYVSDCT